MDTEYRVSLLKLDKQFFDLRRPVSPLGVIFSMVGNSSYRVFSLIGTL